MASVSSANPGVRKKLVELQQQLAKRENVVMDGRDIGTQVLPGAQVKVYLTASARTRAERRYKELLEKGLEADLQKIRRGHQSEGLSGYEPGFRPFVRQRTLFFLILPI